MSATIRSMPELLEVMRARRDELGITHETLDAIAGWPAGYASKLLAPEPIKNLGWVSFGLGLGALGLKLEAVPDDEQVKRVEKRWTKRERAQRTVPPGIVLSIEHEVPMKLQVTPELQRFIRKPSYMREIGLRGNLQRNSKLSPWKRRVLARRAAKARWARERVNA